MSGSILWTFHFFTMGVDMYPDPKHRHSEARYNHPNRPPVADLRMQLETPWVLQDAFGRRWRQQTRNNVFEFLGRPESTSRNEQENVRRWIDELSALVVKHGWEADVVWRYMSNIPYLKSFMFPRGLGLIDMNPG